MQFEIEELGPAGRRVRLTGRLDSHALERLETPFTAAVASSGRSVVIDLRDLEFMSSLGIRLLLSNARVVTRRGGRFVMFGATPAVAEVLGVLALDAVLPHVETEAEALALLEA